MASQGLVDTGKQKMSGPSPGKIEFNDLGSTDNLILEPERHNSIGAGVSWKKRILASILVVALLSAFLGMVFCAWPRQPTISLVSFEFDESVPSTPDENGQLLTNWKGTILISSQNYFDIGVKEIKVNAFIPSNEKTPVGFGQVNDIVIRSRGDTKVVMGFKVPVYQPSSGNPSLIEECMNNSKADLLIKAEIDLNLTHWTGRKLHTTLKKTVDCALPQLFRLISNMLGR